MRTPILSLLCCLLFQTLIAKDYTVSTPDEFSSAVKKLSPGDAIIIKSGTYNNWAVDIAAEGSASKPIIIKAEAKNKVVFSGDVDQTIFNITGKYITLEGIAFTECKLNKATKSGLLIEMNNAEHCRVTDCSFIRNEVKGQFMPLLIVSGKGTANRLDHNYFEANINNQDVQVKITKDTYPTNTLIDHNIFKNKDKVNWKNFNGGECIQIGQDPILLGNAEPKTIVRDNHFTKCGAEPEVISNKSTGNSYIHNVFEDCDGELVMRGGHNCIIDSNTITGGVSGIRVNGTGHKITHNTISNTNTAIRLMYGMARGKKETGFYIAADSNEIRFNKISNVTKGIFIGDSKNVDWTGKFDTQRYPSRVMQDMQPMGNAISDNTFTKVETTVSYN